MMSPEEIREALRAHRLEVVAAETGLAYNTVRRYASGVVIDPPLSTLTALSEWLTANAGRETAAAR
jgi:hypothetical protein